MRFQPPLTQLAIKNLKPQDKPYKKSDGDGLYLLVNPNGAKYWRMNYRINGKQKTLAIGVYCQASLVDDKGKARAEQVVMSLADARQHRDAARALLAKGIDPSETKQEAKKAADGLSPGSFSHITREWHARMASKWVPSHAASVLGRLERYIFPEIGHMPFVDIRTKHMLLALRKVEAKNILDVTGRLRQDLKKIGRYAVQTGRIEFNPGNDLDGALQTRRTAHRPALALKRLPELLERIDAGKLRPLTRAAISLTLLTFVRSSELRFARWEEIDFDRAVWLIPGEREALPGVKFSSRGAKMRTPHLVPLCQQALALFREVHAITGRFELVFAGDHDPYKPMSESTVNIALKRMGYDTKTEVCGHGFRTMACSALSESGQFSIEAIERQMSHQERDSVRAAYTHKAEFLTERRDMMGWWADFLDAQREGAYIEPLEFKRGESNVIPFRRTTAA